MMVSWLSRRIEIAHACFPEAEEYVLGRGVPEWVAMRLRIGVWPDGVLGDQAPDLDFKNRYGPHGERLQGRLIIPLYSPKGDLIGFESRSMSVKSVHRFLLPQARWTPVFIGMDLWAAKRVFDGGNVWLGEGIFDMGALSHVIPSGDVALATLRAHLSRRQADFLRRFCRGTVNIVFDEDEAGRVGARGREEPGRRGYPGAVQVLRSLGVSCREIRYQGGKDPGEIWERSGTEGLRAALAKYME